MFGITMDIIQITLDIVMVVLLANLVKKNKQSIAVLSAIRGIERGEKLETLQISLAAARVNAGMTQEEVAKRMHVSKTTIVNWEKGKIVPGIPEMEMLSRIYRIPQNNIFLPCYSTKSIEREVMRWYRQQSGFRKSFMKN